MSRNILLLEPDVILAKIYAELFENNGYSVSVAKTAQQAITLADTKRPDVVVMEMVLARHSGAAFLYEFRSYSDWLEMPIVMHTTLTPQKLRVFADAFKELGINVCLYKPQTSLQQLLNATQRAVAIPA